MSDNTEFEVINNSKELFNRIEEAIVTNHFKQYEYKNFNNIKEIDSREFIKVYRASWKNSSQYVTLKYFFKLNNTVVEEIIREVITKYDYIHILLIIIFLIFIPDFKLFFKRLNYIEMIIFTIILFAFMG